MTYLNAKSNLQCLLRRRRLLHYRDATAMDLDAEQVRLYRRVTHLISFKLMHVQGAVTVVHGLRVVLPCGFLSQPQDRQRPRTAAKADVSEVIRRLGALDVASQGAGPERMGTPSF